MVELLVNVDVEDLEAAVRFYTGGLGLSLRRRLGPGIAELGGGSSRVFLIQHAAGSRPFAGALAPRTYGRHWTPVHLDVVVTDLEAGVRRAEAAGASCEGEIREFPGGRYRVLADPFGNGFCILELESGDYRPRTSRRE